MGEQETRIASAEKAVDTMPRLFARLADQVGELFEAKLALLRLELKDEISGYLRSTVMLVGGAVVALIGFALLNVALAFLISTLFNSVDISQPARYATGFVITAVLYLIAGAVVILKAKRRIAKQRMVPPRTAAELDRDKEWLQKRL